MDDIHVNRTPFGVKVELSDAYIHQLQTTGKIKQAINQLLADSVKTMVMQRHADIRDLVQDVLNSPDNRAFVQKLFEEEVKSRVSKYVDEVYGKL